MDIRIITAWLNKRQLREELMAFSQSRPRQAEYTGDHSPRRLRPLPAAVIGVAAIALVAGCGSSGNGGNNAGSGNAGNTGSSTASGMTASRALSLAAAQAQKVSSFTATMHIVTHGSLATHMTGTLQERVRPTILAHQVLSIHGGSGLPVPGSMQTLLTGRAMYLKMSTLSQVAGKSWVKIPFSSLKKSMGVDIAPLIHQLQGNNPLAEAQMLPAAANVRQVGSQTINGVPATEYTGSLDVGKAMTRLDPSLRKLVGPALSATGIKTAHFRVWVDGQHQVRKLVETEGGTSYQVTSTIVITSINQPVHIHVPPASQVASMPGM
jgi:hypothetical protein